MSSSLEASGQLALQEQVADEQLQAAAAEIAAALLVAVDDA
jgi:hypothetical protein